MKLDPFPRFPADPSSLIRKLTDLFREHAEQVNKTTNGTRTVIGVDTTDDVVFDDATSGIVLKDTQATPHYWRVTISNVGAIVTTDLGTTKP